MVTVNLYFVFVGVGTFGMGMMGSRPILDCNNCLQRHAATAISVPYSRHCLDAFVITVMLHIDH